VRSDDVDFQRGEVDGLNMIVPYGDRDYYSSRPTIAIPRPGSSDQAALDLDGFFAFHPRLAPLQKLYARRELAIVHACGSPDSTRSHFDAQDYMESATPGMKGTTDGWLNRCLQAKHEPEHSNFRAVSLTQQLPRSLQGHAPALAMNQIGQFGIRGDSTMSASFEEQYASAADTVLGGTREAFDAIKTLKATGPQQYQLANGADIRDRFGRRCCRSASSSSRTWARDCLHRARRMGQPRQRGAATGQLAARLDDFGRGLPRSSQTSAIAWRTSSS
jgi:uncharacterized protein (DUF1501 family)